MTSGYKSAKPHAPLRYLGLACAIGVSTIYFNQPLLPDIAKSYAATAAQAGWVAVATQVGYAAGLLFFVPLGDLMERRSLMTRMYGAVTLALLAVAFAPTLTWLIIGSVVLGMLASVTHVVLPIAPDLVSDKERGRAIGTVMMGLLLGILLARTFAGWVSKLPVLMFSSPRPMPGVPVWLTEGWRYVFLIAGLVNAAFLLMLGRLMPKLPPKQEMNYAEAMRSLWTLFRTQPLLQESSAIGALVFASFSCIWVMLAFLLSSHYGLGAGVAGSFGLIGASGALIAPLAGRMADKRGPRWVVSAGLSLLAISYVLLLIGERMQVNLVIHLAILVVGVIVLDMGAQLTQVGNQTRIFGLVPSARSRINTVYMTVYFTGAAVGSALASWAWQHWRWDGVCGLALVLVGLAFVRHALGNRFAIPVPADARGELAEVERVLEV